MATLPGEGVLLSVDGTAVSQRTSLSGPTFSVEPVETTHMDSTAHTYRPSSIPESGEVSGTLWYDPDDASHQALTDLMVTPATAAWVLTFTDGTATTYTFNGVLSSFEPGGMEIENEISADFTIKVTGAVTIA